MHFFEQFLMYCVFAAIYLARRSFSNDDSIDIDDFIQPVDFCIPKITLNCNTKNESNINYVWRRRAAYVIVAYIENCFDTYHDITFNWTLVNQDRTLSKKDRIINQREFWNKRAFVVHPYSLNIGFYALVLEIDRAYPRKPLARFMCFLRVNPEKPIAYIDGGSARTYSPFQYTIVSGQRSLNFNNPPEEVFEGLRYNWSCTSKDTRVCNGSLRTNTPSIIKNWTGIGHAQGVIQLSVCTEYSGWDTTKILANIKDVDTPQYIRCLKNCKGTTDVHEPVILKIKCARCKPKDRYYWYSPEIPDLENKTVLGIKSKQISFKRGAFKEEKNYTIGFYFERIGKKLISEHKIYGSKKINLKSCEINPSSGIAVSTNFTIKCSSDNYDNPTAYYVFTTFPQENLIAVSFTKTIKVYLHSHKDVEKFLIVRQVDYATRTQSDPVFVDVKVSSSSSSKSIPKSIKFIEKFYNGSNPTGTAIPYLVAKQNNILTAQILHILIGEIYNLVGKATDSYTVLVFKLVHNYRLKILNHVRQFVVELYSDIDLMAGLISHLCSKVDFDLNAEFLNQCVLATATVSDYMKKFLMNINFPSLWEGEVNRTTSTLMYVLNAALKDYSSDIKPPPTNEVYDNGVPIPPELYFDPELEEVLIKYKLMAVKAFKTLKNLTLINSFVMMPGEERRNISANDFYVDFFKERPDMTHKHSIGNQYVQISFEKYAIRQFGKIPMLLMTVVFNNSNPVWWNKESELVSLPVVYLGIYIDDQPFPPQRDLLKFRFYVNEPEYYFVPFSMVLPTVLSQWSEEGMKNHLVVLRVNVKNGGALVVQFSDFTVSDKLMVVCTYNRRPTYEDFKKDNVHLITEGEVVLYTFKESFLPFGDMWFYIAAIPPTETLSKYHLLEQLVFNYSVSFTTINCVYFSYVLTNWLTEACRTQKGTNGTRVVCLCDHHSLYSTLITNPEIKPSILLEPEFKLELQHNNTALALLCVVICLYCILMCFEFMFSEITKNKVYYLSDNLTKDRYAYLVIVKTGNVENAGTTSNITIKFSGCKPHVLNFPDPEVNLLQRNQEDWFVLSTERYIGEIREMILWHDCNGINPAWYCESITVIDLQTEDEYFFNIGKWFSPATDQTQYYIAKYSEDQNRKFHFYNTFTRTHRDHLWNVFKRYSKDDLCYTKRITLILSIILTTFSIGLGVYGVPKFRHLSSLDLGHVDLYTSWYVAVFSGSVGSFFLHLAYILLFRKVPKVKLSIKKQLKKLVWILLIVTIVFNVTFLILFGPFLGRVSSRLWLLSSFAALIQIIVLLEGIQVIVINYIFNKYGKLKKRVLDLKQLMDECEHQRQKLIVKFGSYFFRQQLKDNYSPLTNEEWKISREIELRRQSHITRKKDILLYTSFLFVFYSIIFYYEDYTRARSNNDLRDIVTGVSYPGEIKMSYVEDVNRFYDFIEYTLIPTLSTREWYGLKAFVKDHFVSGLDNSLLGAVRIRQQRVYKICPTAHLFEYYGLMCFPEYTHFNLKDTYSPPYKFTKKSVRLNAWFYNPRGISLRGDMAYYRSGGYSVEMGGRNYYSEVVVHYLKHSLWIERSTRLLVVEFLAYNNNYNVYHFVTLMFEKTASGHFINNPQITSLRLFLTGSTEKLIFYCLLTVFVLLLFDLIFDTIKTTIVCGIKFWKTWNILNFVVVGLTILSIHYYVLRFKWLLITWKDMETQPDDEFINWYELLCVSQKMRLWSGLALLFATFRVLKICNFVHVLEVVEDSLYLVSTHLLTLIICHLYIIVTFAIMGYVSLGSSISAFRNLVKSLSTLGLFTVRIKQKFFNFGSVYQAAMFLAFILLNLVLFGYYFAVLHLHYKKSQKKLSCGYDYYPFKDFVIDNLKFWKMRCNQLVNNLRLAAGSDNTGCDLPYNVKVYSKDISYRYENAIVMPVLKLKAMSMITVSVLFQKFCIPNIDKKKSDD